MDLRSIRQSNAGSYLKVFDNFKGLGHCKQKDLYISYTNLVIFKKFNLRCIMEAVVKAKKIGGSIAVLIPKRIVNEERILADDTLKIRVEKTADLSFLWGRGKYIKKSTAKIMKEIDQGEIDE